MRIQLKDFQHHLKRGLFSLYFVFGEEPLQHNEAIELIRTTAKEQGYTERTVFDISPSFNWALLHQSLQTQSLFASHRLFECRLQDNKIGKMGSDALIKIATSLPEQTILLVSGGKMDTATQKIAWFTTLDRHGITLCARSLSQTETLTWIAERCAATGLQIDKEAVEELAIRTEGNLVAAAQAINRLTLASRSSEPISRTDIQEQVNHNAHFSLFDLVDAILIGSVRRTIQVLSSLKNESIEPILVLWAITREVRIIIRLAYAIKAGRALTDALDELGIWKHRTKLTAAFVQRFPISTLLQFLIQAKAIDETLKGHAPGDTWCALEKLCIRMTTKKLYA